MARYRYTIAFNARVEQEWEVDLDADLPNLRERLGARKADELTQNAGARFIGQHEDWLDNDEFEFTINRVVGEAVAG